MSCTLRGLVAAVVLAALVASPAPRALADVDVAIRSGDRVAGTLSPADEVETFRALLPQDALLSVSVKGRKPRGGAAPVVTFRVLGPNDAEALPFQPTKGTGAKVRNHRVETTGVHKIEVKGDGANAGDYQLTVSWTSPKKFGISGDLSGGPFSTAFDADVGASSTFQVKARGPGVEPVLTEIRDAADSVVFTFTPPADGAASHKAGNVPLPDGGRYTLVVGGVGGTVTGAITVKPPKAGKRAVVITDAKIGDAGGEREAVGEVVGPEGGTVGVEGTSLAIEGATVEVPQGSLPSPTAIIVATSADVTPGAGQIPAGPAVYFGPEGLTFPASAPALVTLPFDAALSGGNAANVRVRVRDAKGKVKELTFDAPYPLVDLVEGKVTFPVSHFSSYQAFVVVPRRIPGDLNGDGFGDLVLRAPSADGGAGRVYVFFGGTSLTSGTSADADVVFAGRPTTQFEPLDEFGRAVLVADLNADGVDDLAVAGRNDYRVEIWFGGAGFGGPPDASILSGIDPNFGISLAAADVGGTAAQDLVVGDESGVVDNAVRGAAYVYFGPLVAGERLNADADFTVTGLGAGDLLGAAVAAGDVIGSGRDAGHADLVVGADQADTANGTGAVYVFEGPLTPGTVTAAAATVTLTGESAFDGFGLKLAVGDFDGSGRGDLAVASEGWDLDISTDVDAGRVYLFRGEDGILSGSASGAAATVSGSAGGMRLGNDLRSGNPFADSDSELLIGIAGRESVGIVDSLQTRTFDTLRRITRTGAISEFGIAIAAPSDVNGDGRDDVIVSARGDDTGGVDAGKVYVFFGGASQLTSPYDADDADLTFVGAAGEQLGAKGD